MTARFRITKLLAATVFILIALNTGMSRVTALDMLNRTQMGLDESIVVQDDNYSQPDSIIITPIYIEGSEFVSDYDWYKGLFYYQTVRLNQGDFMFHYIVSKSGQVFKGMLKGEEQRVRTEDSTYEPIVIAYLSNENDTEFDPVSKTALSELILEIANRNAINMDNVYVKSIEYIAKEGETVKARFGSLGGRWERILKEMVTPLKALYKPQARTFDLKIDRVELPANAVNYGDNVVMTITLTNNSSFLLLKGSIAEPIVTLKSGASSKFFLNGVWNSLSQVSVMGEASYIKPGETKSFQVRLAVPLYFGLIKESFYLADATGKKYPNSDFDVSITVNRLDKKVIEVVNTKQLNVRANPWYSAGIVSKVTEGTRYVVLEETSDGWLKLDLGNSKSGWVVRAYTRTV